MGEPIEHALRALANPLMWVLLFLAWASVTAPHTKAFASAVVGFWALSAPVSVETMAAAWERSYPPVAVDQLPVQRVALVLGGGLAPATRDGAPINWGAASDRVVVAAQLFHAGRVKTLWLTGGADPDRFATSEAAAMAEALRALGVPDTALRLESDSRTTRENAALTAALWPQSWPRTGYLVTSAGHQRRALGDFTHHGFTLQPIPTDPTLLVFSGVQRWLPQGAALEESQALIKEVLGVFLQYLRRELKENAEGRNQHREV